MKKTVSIFLIAISTAILSCKKDNAEKKTEAKDFVGNWNLSKYTTDLYYKDNVVASYEGAQLGQLIDTLILKNDGTGQMINDEVLIRKFNYNFENNNTEFYISQVKSFYNNQWYEQGNAMWVIVSFDNNQLVLGYDTFLPKENIYRKDIKYNRYRILYHFKK